MGSEWTNSISGERNAVHLKYAEPVQCSDREPVQPKSGRGLGQRTISAEGAVPLLDQADFAKLVEFFLLLDAWDQNRVRLVAPSAGFGSNKIVPARERGTEGHGCWLSEDSQRDCSSRNEADSSCRLCLTACNCTQIRCKRVLP